MPRLCFSIVIAVVLASGGDAQYTYGISGQVTWDSIGPCPNFAVGFSIATAPPFPNIHYFWTLTDKNGRFSTLVRTHLYGQMAGCYSHQIPGLDHSIYSSFTLAGSGAVFNIRILPPTIFVHGLNGGPANWATAANGLFPTGGVDPRAHAIAPAARFFIEHEWKRSHVENARILAERIKALKENIFASMKLPPAPLDLNLVCHNSGGLVARAYIANHTGGVNEDRVVKCITVGTPHFGMAWLELLPEKHPLFALSRSLYQMRPSYVLNRFPLELKKSYGNTGFYLVGSSLNINPIEPEIIANWPFSKDDDGLVSTFSATHAFPGARVVAVKNYPYLNDQLPWKFDAATQVVNWIRNSGP